jgi:hypothetical protein
MSRTVYSLPVKPYPVKFRTMVNDTDYWFATQYREADEAGWVLDILNANENPLIMGIALVSGLDLMWQYHHMALDFSLVMSCRENRGTPTYESLGSQDELLLVTGN